MGSVNVLKCFLKWTHLRFLSCVFSLSRVQPFSGSLCSGAAAGLSLAPVSLGNPLLCSLHSSIQTVKSRKKENHYSVEIQYI